MKKLLSLLLCAVLLVSSLSMTALAAASITVTIDGQTVSFPDQSPALKNGVAYVPIRGVFEQMGATVDYIEAAYGVRISASDVEISFAIGSDTVTVTQGGKTETIKLENATYLMNNRTMVPLRFIAETLGCSVHFDDISSTVTIISTTIATPTPEVLELGAGTMQVYDFGELKLHAYQTGDYIDNESFLLETATELIMMELAPFYDNIKALASYIESLGKPLNSVIVAYHPAGAAAYSDSDIYASEGLGEAALVAGFVDTFGDIFNGSLPTEYENVGAGTMTIGGIQFNVIETTDAFDLEIPAINVYLTHMVGHNTHNILASIEHIDATIAEMKNYQAKKYALILSGHDVPRTIEIAAEKIGYLEKTKELVLSCATAEEFIAAMSEVFPDYAGGSYLEMSAGMIYG